MGLGNVGAVFLFEWRRALTATRLAWWLALALFPVFITLLVRMTAVTELSREPWAILMFVLVPMLISTLGTLLWTAPAVSTELERKSWVYLAVRPHGKTAVLLGKFLAAVTWVLPAALLGLTLSLAIARTGHTWQIWWTMTRLVLLACPAYAAVYLLLGTLFPQRPMVIAVAYTLIFELIVGFIPAIINKGTVQYRLRALLIDWAEIPLGDPEVIQLVDLFGDAPATYHVMVLLMYILAFIATAVAVIRWREFSTAAEADA